MRQLLFLLACLGMVSSLLAQESTVEGTLKDTELLISKELKHPLPEASRLFMRAPSLPSTALPKLAYHLLDLCPEFDILLRKPKILRAKHDTLTQLYGNHLRGSYGNLHAPYLEVFLVSKHHPHRMEVHVKHASEGQATYLEESHNMVQLHGKFFTDPLYWEGTIAYDRDQYQVYTVRDGSVSQILQQVALRKKVSNHSHNLFHYQVDAAFYCLADIHRVYENQGHVSGKGIYELTDACTSETRFDLYLVQHFGAAVTHRNLCKLKTILFFRLRDLDVRGGVRLVYQNKVAYAPYRLNIYPIMRVDYTIHKGLQFYGGLKGDTQQFFLQDLLQENCLSLLEIDLRHTDQRFEFFGGAEGSVAAHWHWQTGFSAGVYQHFHCLVNSASEPGRFDVCYDPATTVCNVFGELTYTNRTESLTMQLRGDYFCYRLQNLPKPWHRPRYRLDLLSTYRLYDKMTSSATIRWEGGVAARQEVTKNPVSMATIIDIDLGIEYLWNSRFSGFFDAKNILARGNARHFHYPSRGFFVMLGLTYAW